MPAIRIETEIAAPPSEVRAVVRHNLALSAYTIFPNQASIDTLQILDFAAYSTWHTSFITSISPLTVTTTPPISLPAGTPLSVSIRTTHLTPIIESNVPTEFAWYGSILHGAFAGRHSFQFLESKITEGGTTFVHAEEFDGWLIWLFSEQWYGLKRKGVLTDFETFSGDVKRRVEGLQKQRKEFVEAEQAALAKI